MALQPSSKDVDVRRMAEGPALAMEQRVVKLLDLAAGVGRAGIAAQQPASRHKRLGAGGFEHSRTSQDYGVGQRRQQRSKRAASPRPPHNTPLEHSRDDERRAGMILAGSCSKSKAIRITSFEPCGRA